MFSIETRHTRRVSAKKTDSRRRNENSFGFLKRMIPERRVINGLVTE